MYHRGRLECSGCGSRYDSSAYVIRAGSSICGRCGCTLERVFKTRHKPKPPRASVFEFGNGYHLALHAKRPAAE